MNALLLAALLAQVVAPSPAAVRPSFAPAGPALPATPGGGPGAVAPPLSATPAPGDALIVNSGSTNTAPYTIDVHPDGTADVAIAGQMQHAHVGAPQAHWLFAKLKSAAPLASLPRAGCMKSASFGTSTTIVYDGSRTPDLSCPGGSALAQELGRTAGVIVNQLGIKPLTPRRRLQE